MTGVEKYSEQVQNSAADAKNERKKHGGRDEREAASRYIVRPSGVDNAMGKGNRAKRARKFLRAHATDRTASEL